MGSIERRIQQLEDLYQRSPAALEAEQTPEELEKRRAFLHQLREEIREMAEREAAEGDYRRLNALRDLEEAVRRRCGA